MNNRGVPDMRINREYAEMFQDYTANKANQTAERRDAVQFVKQKLDSAQWFIDAIKQRNETLQRTMEAIIYLQRDFFLTGDEATLHPMILKDVAERAGYDISTISRVSNSKYVQTNFGIYPLKYFFSESMQTDTGEEISTREVKKIMKEHVDAEDKRKPLTDEELATILKEKGYETKDGLGNYIFIKTKKAPKELEKELKEERKILIKTFGNPMLSEYIRVSTGSKNAMEFFVEKFLDVDE